jgi:hypothetical protein
MLINLLLIPLIGIVIIILFSSNNVRLSYIIGLLTSI